MDDTIVFMSAYHTTKFSKSKLPFKRNPGLISLLDNHHLIYILMKDKLISSKGVLTLSAEYDYVQQYTNFLFIPEKKGHSLNDFSEILECTGLCTKLLHAQSILSDSSYFEIDYIICMESFFVHIDGRIFQIDPATFSMNGTLIIIFEVVDYETGLPLKKDDIFGKSGNYNLLTINQYEYW